jgi:hypothetical protein
LESLKLIACGLPLGCDLPAMNELDLFFLFLTITTFGLLVAGLYKPWVVLWWEDVQNRRKVFKVYGTMTLLAFVTWVVLMVYF